MRFEEKFKWDQKCGSEREFSILWFTRTHDNMLLQPVRVKKNRAKHLKNGVKYWNCVFRVACNRAWFLRSQWASTSLAPNILRWGCRLKIFVLEENGLKW
jgi:hypothetical protein